MAAAQPQGGFTVTVKHERTAHAVEVDGGTTVALLQTRLFLRSNVLPMRQKLMGFKGVPSPAPGATMSELKASGGMKLMMLPGPDRPPIDENADASSPLFVPAVQAVWSACALCMRCTPAVTSENRGPGEGAAAPGVTACSRRPWSYPRAAQAVAAMRAYAVAAGVEIGALKAAPPALEQAEAAARSEVLEHSVRESVCCPDPHVAATLLASLMG